MSRNIRLARTGVSTPTCLPTYASCLFFFPALCAVIVPPFVLLLLLFAFYKLPEEDSRKHTSRKATGLASIRLARPEVSQAYVSQGHRSRKHASRKARGLARDVSQGQTRVSQGQMSCNRRLARTGVSTPTCLPTFVSCLFIIPALCAVIVPPFVLLLLLFAFYKLPEEDSRKHTSRKARGLAVDVSQEAIHCL